MKDYWITDSRFKWISLLLFLIFVIFMLFFYLKAEEVTKDPCSICAKRMGENVICTTGGIIPLERVYYTDGSILNRLFGE